MSSLASFFNYALALTVLIGFGIFLWIQFGGYLFDWFQQSGESIQVYIDGHPLTVSVADTPEQRRQGLSGTFELKPYTGKLFIFDEPKKYGIWMKDMNYPIDILWFDTSYRLVDFKIEAQPSSYPDIFAPNEPALYVVEVPAGTVNDLQLQIGNKLELPAYLTRK